MHAFAIPLLLAAAATAAEISPAVADRARETVIELLVDGRLAGGAVWVDASHALTCAHPIPTPGARLELIDRADRRLPAALVAVDLGHDLALLRSDGAGPHAVARIADAAPARAAPVFIFAPALRNPPVFIPGRVASDRPEAAEWSSTGSYLRATLIAAATPQLTSGGPWFDAEGRLAGVQSGFLNMDKGDPSGLALIAPWSALRRLVETRADAATPDLGGWLWEIWTAASEHIDAFPRGANGLIVTRAEKDGPLDKAGIRRLDLVVACDGRPLARRRDLLDALDAASPGVPLRLAVRRPRAEAVEEISVAPVPLEPAWRAKK